DLLGIALAHAQNVLELALLNARYRRIADHATIGDDADPANGKTLTQAVDYRQQGGNVSGVPRPHLRAHGPSILIHDDPEHHLVEMGPLVLALALFTQRVRRRGPRSTGSSY